MQELMERMRLMLPKRGGESAPGDVRGDAWGEVGA
jgi:hypothetical protein